MKGRLSTILSSYHNKENVKAIGEMMRDEMRWWMRWSIIFLSKLTMSSIISVSQSTISQLIISQLTIIIVFTDGERILGLGDQG